MRELLGTLLKVTEGFWEAHGGFGGAQGVMERSMGVFFTPIMHLLPHWKSYTAPDLVLNTTYSFNLPTFTTEKGITDPFLDPPGTPKTPFDEKIEPIWPGPLTLFRPGVSKFTH